MSPSGCFHQLYALEEAPEQIFLNNYKDTMLPHKVVGALCPQSKRPIVLGQVFPYLPPPPWLVEELDDDPVPLSCGVVGAAPCC